MKNVFAVLVAMMSLGLCALAQAPKESGWISLFNGKDLTGWKNNGQEKWVVENGTIYCESTANKYGYLTTEKAYKDFDFRLKFKGRSGRQQRGISPRKNYRHEPRNGPRHPGNAGRSRSQHRQTHRGPVRKRRTRVGGDAVCGKRESIETWPMERPGSHGPRQSDYHLS